jgi:hypothetical protein
MPTSTELIQDVKDAVLGASFSNATILRSINKGINRVAGMVLLPDLEASHTVTTGTGNYLDLPDDFHREIQAVYDDANERKVKIYESFVEFLNRYPGLAVTGSTVEAVSKRAQRLYYQPIPDSAQTVTVYYYRKPIAMVEVSTPPVTGAQITPDGIPDHLATDLLVSFAAMDLWRNIEQDENNQPNVEKYASLFGRALMELREFVGEEDGEPDYITRNWGGEAD